MSTQAPATLRSRKKQGRKRNWTWSVSMMQKKTVALLITGLALPLIAAQPTPPPTPQPDALSHQVPGFFYAGGRSYLGIDIRDVTTDRLSALKLKEERGVEIVMVDAD